MGGNKYMIPDPWIPEIQFSDPHFDLSIPDRVSGSLFQSLVRNHQIFHKRILMNTPYRYYILRKAFW